MYRNYSHAKTSLSDDRESDNRGSTVYIHADNVETALYQSILCYAIYSFIHCKSQIGLKLKRISLTILHLLPTATGNLSFYPKKYSFAHVVKMHAKTSISFSCQIVSNLVLFSHNNITDTK